MATATGSIGVTLRDARERRGVSLRDIADATKISVAALEALERDDISRLPGGIFTRAFVRSYALQVGLDPEQTVHDFIAQFPQDSVTAGHPASASSGIEDDAFGERQRTASVFLKVAGLSVPVAALVFYLAGARRFVTPDATPTAAVTAQRTEAPPPSASPPVEAAPADPKPDPAVSDAAPPNGGLENPLAEIEEPALTPQAADSAVERLKVGLAVRARCWVSVVADGARALQRELQPGEVQSFEVKSEFVVTAGNAGALVLTLNGAEARPLGKPGEVVTRRLNLSNYKTYLTP